MQLPADRFHVLCGRSATVLRVLNEPRPRGWRVAEPGQVERHRSSPFRTTTSLRLVAPPRRDAPGGLRRHRLIIPVVTMSTAARFIWRDCRYQYRASEPGTTSSAARLALPPAR